MARIKIRFSFKTGAPILGVTGVHGSKCTDISKSIEEALGQVAEQTKTAEYYLQEKEVQTGDVRIDQQDA